MSVSALAIFACTYLALAVGGLPGLRVDRTGVAIIGAVLMLVTGVVSMGQAIAAIDYNTVVLLYGMMLLAGSLRLAGFFRLATVWVLERAHRPLPLLVAVTLVSGVLSAFFVNDIVCLVLTPLVIAVTRRAGVDPRPYLLALASASNIGSVATITGNPQNMMIGSLSGLSYVTFLAHLGPVAIIGLGATVGVILLAYRRELSGATPVSPGLVPVARVHRPLLLKAMLVTGAVLVGFIAGLPVSLVAVCGGAGLLLTRRVKPAKMYAAVDWNLLVLFVGLFIVVGGAEQSGLTERVFRALRHLDLHRPALLAAVIAILSNLFSNVPAVMLFRSLVPTLPDPAVAWLTIAMGSTLAGNLTLLGSVANLIVVEQARANRVEITFADHARVGIPLTLATLAIGIAVLRLLAQ
jgi:Na+/H+ antiporter NhaD/arsenite permease-like protein